MHITQNNYRLYAAKIYRNPVFLDAEFDQDLSLIKRVAGKIEKFGSTGNFPTRLVFNNFTIACNCFGLDFVSKSLFLLSNPTNHDLILTFITTVTGYESSFLVNEKLKIKFDPLRINHSFQKIIFEDLRT